MYQNECSKQIILQEECLSTITELVQNTQKDMVIDDLVEIKLDVEFFEKDETVIKYMAKYGIENVRGSAYCLEFFTQVEIIETRKRIASIYDFCFRCNSVGHFAHDCSEKTN